MSLNISPPNSSRTPAENAPTRPRTRRRRGVRNPWTTPGTVLAALVLVLAVLAALFPQLFTGNNPNSGTFEPLLALSG